MSRLDIDPEDRRPLRDGARAPREPLSRQRPRRFWVRPLKAVAVALILIAAAWGVRAVNQYILAPPNQEAAVPTFGPDQTPFKVAPAQPGGMQVPNQDSIVLNGEGANPKVEQLLPPPEAPLPSPQPPQTTTTVEVPQPVSPPSNTPPALMPDQSPPPPVMPTVAAPTVAVPSLAPAAPVTSSRQATAPPILVTPGNSVPATVVPAMPVKPPPQQATAPPPAAIQAPAALAGKGWFLQLGAVRSTEAAQQEWNHLKGAQGDLLGSLAANAVRVDLGDRGIFYRIVAGPIAEESAATRTCNALKQRNVGCILLKP